MRLEYKYLAHNSKFEGVRKALMPFLEYDSFAEQRDKKEYTVRSIYFDTPRMDYYYEKIEGLKLRKKFRIRGYNSLFGEKVVFLEIKRKYGPYGTKNRSPVLYGDLPALFETGNIEDYVLTNKKSDNPIKDGKRFFFHYFKNLLKPTVLVVYEREPYFVKLNSRIRITFDKNLRYLAYPSLNELYNEEKLNYATPGYFLLELKFDRAFPRWLSNIVKRFNLERMAFSKYSTCLDAHYKHNRVEKFIRRSYLTNVFEEEELQEELRNASGFSKYN